MKNLFYLGDLVVNLSSVKSAGIQKLEAEKFCIRVKYLDGSMDHTEEYSYEDCRKMLCGMSLISN